MAGSWEPLPFRVRRDGSPGYEPTPEQKAAYHREHSAEMINELKALGVNFIMGHCYKAFGMGFERESMADAVRFTKLCHDAGLRVGVYTSSGTMGWELLFKEAPQAKEWVVLNEKGEPTTYGGATYRYYWNRNHPEAAAYHKQLVRFAIEDIRADLVHLDNYHIGPGMDTCSTQRFREYLGRKFTSEQLEKMGVKNLSEVKPVMSGAPDKPLRRAWIDFTCQSLADSYLDVNRYARSLRKDILMECNPGGVEDRFHIPVDHGRLIGGGEAFWDEGGAIGYKQGRLASRIRTYKVARRMDNIAFAYTTTPLEMAEAMAFNLDCLGCICWFEYGKITIRPGGKDPASKELAPYIRFFHKRRDLLGNAGVVADVAVLRNFPSMAYTDPKDAPPPSEVEQAFILNRIPFQIIYDHQLSDLKRYRVLVLVGCVALSDAQIAQIVDYAKSGGHVLVVGPVATHDEWMLPRERAGLGDVVGAAVLRIDDRSGATDAVRKLIDNDMSMAIDAQPGLCAELTAQPDRRMVHLVNYRSDGPAKNATIRVRLPEGKQVKSVTLAGPQHPAEAPVKFEKQGRMVAFTVPSVEVYEIAVVTWNK